MGKLNVIISTAIANGEVAQLARASGSYPAGRRFESHLRYQIKTVLQIVVQFFIV